MYTSIDFSRQRGSLVPQTRGSGYVGHTNKDKREAHVLINIYIYIYIYIY
jgi:hypothetical protein